MKLEKYIIARATDLNKLIEAVQALANLYVESRFTDVINIHRVHSENDLFIISFPIQPDFERFKYFVNYLHYPEAGSCGSETKGFWTIDNQSGIPKQLVGSRVMLYISDNDNEYDNVYSAFDSTSEHYKLGFASGEEFVKLTSSEPAFSENDIQANNLELVKTVTPDDGAIEKRNNPNSKGIGCLMLLPLIFTMISLVIIYVL